MIPNFQPTSLLVGGSQNTKIYVHVGSMKQLYMYFTWILDKVWKRQNRRGEKDANTRASSKHLILSSQFNQGLYKCSINTDQVECTEIQQEL